MNQIETFTITEDHIKLLKRAYWSWFGCEYGAPAIDCKRPFGNSSVAYDVAEILDWPLREVDGDWELTEFQEMTARKLVEELVTVLQIATVTLQFKPGVYEKTDRYVATSWRARKAQPNE